jgi:hypothetical protein
MNTQKQYNSLLLEIAKCADEEKWSETMSLLDTTFGQEDGYFINRFESHTAFFDNCTYFHEEFGDNLEEDLYDWVGEYTYGFEAFLERTILCQIFRKMTPEETNEFIQKRSFKPTIKFGETTWKLTNSGKHDFYITPVGFQLHHDFRE